VARDVQHLLAFVGLNMQGMRKILKKVRAIDDSAFLPAACCAAFCGVHWPAHASLLRACAVYWLPSKCWQVKEIRMRM